MDEEKKKKIIDAVKLGDKTIKEIANKLYLSEHHLKMLLEEWGVEFLKKRKYKRMPTPDRDTLLELYSKYKTVSKVAEHFNVSYSTVRRWMDELSIPPKKLMGKTQREKAELLEKHIEKLDFDL